MARVKLHGRAGLSECHFGRLQMSWRHCTEADPPGLTRYSPFCSTRALATGNGFVSVAAEKTVSALETTILSDKESLSLVGIRCLLLMQPHPWSQRRASYHVGLDLSYSLRTLLQLRPEAEWWHLCLTSLLLWTSIMITEAQEFVCASLGWQSTSVPCRSALGSIL